MGNLIRQNSINPQNQICRRRKSLLCISESSREVSRANLKYISQFSTTGVNQQSITWIANNIEDPSELFFVKQSDKYTVYNNKRIQSLKNEMRLLSQDDVPFTNPYYQYLYMVSQYTDGYTLEEVMREHSFTEEQTKYVVMVLINIIDAIHSKGFVIGQLSPRNIIVDKKTCSIKLIELTNPIRIDEYYPSETINQINPYSAPEIIVMDKVCGEADFYSLGLIMYQMITQKSLIFNQTGQTNDETQRFDRASILNHQITVTKSDLPEGWSPQATDMLIRLIIKNTQLRLGRYGSFQVRNHAWLQNSNNWELFNDVGGRNLPTGQGCRKNRRQTVHVPYSGINLSEKYFTESRKIQHNINNFALKEAIRNQRKEKHIASYAFQQLFQDYQFKRSGPLPSIDETQSILDNQF